MEVNYFYHQESLVIIIRATMSSSEVSLTSLAPFENTTYTYDASFGTTSELDITHPHARSRYTIAKAFLIIICISGFVANLAMLVSLLLQRRAARKTVNIFICNQTVLDLVATTVLFVKHSLMMSGYLNKKTGVLMLYRPRSKPVDFHFPSDVRLSRRS